MGRFAPLSLTPQAQKPGIRSWSGLLVSQFELQLVRPTKLVILVAGERLRALSKGWWLQSSHAPELKQEKAQTELSPMIYLMLGT